jgi:hypothetical protein
MAERPRRLRGDRQVGDPAEAFAGIPSSGRSFGTRVACLCEFERDELVRERDYMHFGDIAVTRSR